MQSVLSSATVPSISVSAPVPSVQSQELVTPEDGEVVMSSDLSEADASPSLSNTVERIRPVNGLTRLVRLVRPVQVVKQWFTGCTGRGSMVPCISLVTLHLNLDGTTRTSRTTRTGRETMVYESYSW